MHKVLLTLILAGLSWQGIAAESSIWRAHSVESQFQQQRGEVDKSSQPLPSTYAAKPTLQQLPARSLSAKTVATNPDFWIYDAVVTLRRDNDYDGYYHQIVVDLDADTIYDRAQVYARFYLGHNGHYDEYHTSSLFYVSGQNADDVFTVDSTLVEGFPADDYDLYIELYDGLTDQLVATLSSDDDADLYRLPLESKDYDRPASGTVVSVEYAGSSGIISLTGLVLMIGWRRAIANRHRYR